MRRFAALLAMLLLLAALPAAAFAAQDTLVSATGIQCHAAVATDGSCTVTLSVEFRLAQPVDNITFPLPRNAKGITVNSAGARISRTSDATVVKLDHLIGSLPGTFTIMFSYNLSGCVAYNEAGQLMLTVPLLSGFEYPVEDFAFTVALPGEITTEPSFSSGYHLTSIESSMDFRVDGTSVSGALLEVLKDRETLTMTMPVTETMFPQEVAPEWTAGLDDVLLYVAMGLAFVYWLVFMRCLPPRLTTTSLVPGGVTAGELGSVLTGTGADLSMMVLSWAQMGYILIHVDRHGRVFLHKRMEMGNERSPFEIRVFQTLFGKKNLVDGTGRHYALLYRKVEKSTPNVHEYYRHSSGSHKLLRFIACGAGLMGGISPGLAIGGGSFITGLLALALGGLGTVSAWHIQSAAMELHLRFRQSLWIGMIASAVWLVLGLLAGEITNALMVVIFELLTGLATAYGGRRTPLGRQAMSQVLGLRRYLNKVNRAQLQRICRDDPEYFFSQAPYAMALGVAPGFAKRFGPGKLPACSYLTTGMDAHMNAEEWLRLMNRAVNALDERQKRMKLRRYLGQR